MSKKITTSDKWDIFFRSEIKSVYEETREIIKKPVLSETEYLKLRSLANRIFNEFNDSPIPVRAPNESLDYSPEMYSTSVLLPSGCINIPYFFIGVIREDPTFSFEKEFNQDIKWQELIGLIFQKWLNRRIKLTKTMVLICKTLSRYGTEGQLFRFPITHEVIANRTRQSLSSVKMTFPTLYAKSIVYDLFLINNWKVGWELYLLSYSYQFNAEFVEYDEITLSLEICAGKKAFRVIQYPMLDDGAKIDKIKILLNKIGGKIYQIHSIDFHWDLSQLHTKEDTSFRQIPDYLDLPPYIRPNIHFEFESNSLDWVHSDSSQTTTTKIFTKIKTQEETSISTLKMERIIKVLNYLAEYSIPMINYEVTAEKIGIPVKEFGEILRYLIKNRVIALSQRFKHIGAGHEYSFIIENTSSDVNYIIKQTLLQNIFSQFYESNDIIAGRIQVPDKWVANLLEFFVRLNLRYPHLNISYAQRLIGYSMYIPNIKFPKNYFLNAFGTYLTSRTNSI